MLKTRRLLLLATFYILNSLFSIEPTEDNYSASIDLSVYDGEGSLLLLWSYPDSIQVKSIKIFSKKSNQLTFNLVSEQPPEATRYLDLDCEPNKRVFYKVEIEDLFGHVHSSDLNMPSFGSCKEVKQIFEVDFITNSLKDLAVVQILAMLNIKDSNGGFADILEMLKYSSIEKTNWLHNYSADQLKDLNQNVKIVHDLIKNSDWSDSLSLKKPYFSNHLLLTPEQWDEELLFINQDITKKGEGLYPSYLDAISFLSDVEPIRIVKYNFSEEFGKSILIYLFDRQKIFSEEVYLLSNDEYINVTDYIFSDSSIISIDIPRHWKEIKLMMNDSVMQTCKTIFDSSIFYTIQNDIIPSDSTSIYRIKRDDSMIWLNEIIWKANSKALQVEIAGETDFGSSYSIFINGKSMWDVRNFDKFGIQYHDSSFSFPDPIDFPLVLEFKRFDNVKDQTIEYHILDSISFTKNRILDKGRWTKSEISTLGVSNKTEENSLDNIILPKSFILYQNYPNPFNGETRITFDLLEDATVSLYVIDAKGRVQDKFIDNEYINSGTYNFNWAGENKSTGIYFFTIHVEVKNYAPTVLSRKMIYLK